MSLLETLLPATCVSCRRLPKTLCDECSKRLNVRPRRVEREFVGWAAMDYSDTATKVINAFKEHGRTSLLAQLCELADELPIPAGCILVGLPSGAKATRRRGFVPAELLAQRLARRRGVNHANALTSVRKIADQSALGRRERIANLAGSMIAKPLNLPVLLVDDVVTTGSSIREAVRAMRAAGNDVIGFIALAEAVLTPR